MRTLDYRRESVLHLRFTVGKETAVWNGMVCNVVPAIGQDER